MAPGFGTGTLAFGEQKTPQRRVKEWSPIDRMLAEKGSKRRSKTELPPISPSPPPVTTTETQVQTDSWVAFLKEALAISLVPEQQKYKALQSEMAAVQLQLKEKQEEVAAVHLQLKEKQDEIESQRRRAAEAENAHAAELARLAAEHFRLMGENSQLMEEKKSMDELKKTFEKQRLCWAQEREAFEAAQNLLRAELQSARTEIDDENEKWRKEAVATSLVPEQQKYDALQSEMAVAQLQLKEKQEEVAAYGGEQPSRKCACCGAGSAHGGEQPVHGGKEVRGQAEKDL
ncbi:unnamed protein product [Durusdinium trenchii]|uniref:Uncharacterized protein n=1 Tax=Durusdinium trenchii TaxID=1381693 RepID=A0ABP0S3C4_9DINO